MTSHEKKIQEKHEKKDDDINHERLNIATLKYFWQASPLASGKKTNIPKFLRNIKVFDSFSDYELKKFSGFIHQRVFLDGEVIIEEGDGGFGFYLIFNGNVEIFSKRSRTIDGVIEVCQQRVTELSQAEYFGELALLEKQNRRNATAISKGGSTLLSIYKPDIEELIDRYPVIGAKFLQGIALIVAQRFNRITVELREVKEKLIKLEENLESSS